MEQNDLISKELQVTEIILSHLRETARWARFLAIIGFVMVGFLLLAAVILPGMMVNTNYSELEGTFSTEITTTGIRINFIILAVLLFFPCLFLFRFANRMKDALLHNQQDSFEESFQNLKSTFKFYGILAIIVLAIYAIAFVSLLLFMIFQVA